MTPLPKMPRCSARSRGICHKISPEPRKMAPRAIPVSPHRHVGKFRVALSRSNGSRKNEQPMKLDIHIASTRANHSPGATRTAPAQLIEVKRDATRIRVEAAGKIIEGDAIEVATSTYSVLLNGHSYEVRVEPAFRALRVH